MVSVVHKVELSSAEPCVYVVFHFYFLHMFAPNVTLCMFSTLAHYDSSLNSNTHVVSACE